MTTRNNEQQSGNSKLKVPGYDEVVDRNEIAFLKSPGNLALTPRGDLMLNNPCYIAFF